MEKPHLSVIVPAFNESSTIEETIKRVAKVFNAQAFTWELLIIDDGSSDDTVEKVERLIAENSTVRLLILSRNFGHQNALSAGLDMARGDYIAIMDADLQDPPEILIGMLQTARNGFDVVFGVRKSRRGSWYKRTAYWLYYRLLRLVSEQPISIDSGDFAVMSRRVVTQINKMPERNRFLRGLRSWVGFKQHGFSYERPERYAGSAKYDLAKLSKLATDGLLSSTKLPLKLSIYLGIGLAGIGFIWAAKVFFTRLFFDTAPEGFSALMVAVLVVGGAQLIAIGVLGAYLGRVLDQVEGRPTYIIERKVNF